MVAAIAPVGRVPSALICGSETLRTASQRGALAPMSEATRPRTASPISDTAPKPFRP